MRIIALLSWYDEPTWTLSYLTSSLARAGIDHIVAVDGAYGLFPGGRAHSPGDQAQAILAAAQGAQMGVTVHAPRTVWVDNEVEKRSFLFAAGHLVAEPGEDWFLVVDADEFVTESDGLREGLEATTLDTAEIVLTSQAGQELNRHLYRAQPSGIEVRGNHYTYVTGDGRVLWAGNGNPAAPAEQLLGVRIEHRPARDLSRSQARETYYQRRDSLEIEHVHA